MVSRRTFLAGTVLGVLTGPLAGQSVPAGRLPRIGILALRKPEPESPMNEALMQGLRDHGYVVGRNLLIEYADALENEDRLPGLAAELVRSKPDLILIIGPAGLAPARKATATIPLVMVASSSDPVAEGLAASLARPGGNVTGLTYAEPDRFKKQLEMLKAAVPGAGRIAVLWDFDLEIYRRSWSAPLADAGRALGVNIQDPVRVKNEGELRAAFALMKQRQLDAFLVASGSFLFRARASVAELAIKHRLPGMAAYKEFPQAGLLMSYGPDFADINRRAAAYVDRILKGARPGDLPIELPSKHELAINETTAKHLGLAIPQSMLLRANEVIR